ncbi:tellurite resistance TerB family protein [Rhizobium pusense]|uniref:tellurite resistance TerB family protein n=1 Tax=Agrobacterium pusense TaxID=648995 RepID=UPI00244C4C93|nr:tellurite resistance TerB family protein [Agrobacterium pusense]MDH0116779.1 tellurite resistance TerB family protein [Agrobacterium pusense]
MLAMFKSLVGDKAKKFSGKTDFLEAVCAASALVATADGDLDDSELLAAVAAVKSNAALSGAFDARAIETTMDKMCSRAVGRVGKAGLFKEIDDIKADHDMSETVLLVALDVADSGGISDDEKAVLAKIASTVGLDLAKYL